MLTILFVLFEISNIFGQLIVANNYDSTTETEIYNISSSTSSNQSINCGATNSGATTCIISCILTNSCSGLIIAASSVQYLEVNCLASEACHDINVDEGPTIQTNITCQSSEGRSCYGANFTLTHTPSINVVCDNSGYTDTSSSYGSCYESIVRIEIADQVTINCVGPYDCESTQIYVDNVTTQAIITGDGESSLQFATISCRASEACYISCGLSGVCESASISAGLTKYLRLDCLAYSACYGLYITEGPTDRTDINCITTEGDEACGRSEFILTNTAEVSIICSANVTATSSQGNCEYMILRAENAERVTIDCNENYDCYQAAFYLNNVSQFAQINANDDDSLRDGEIYASYAGTLDIKCNSKRACFDLNVYPPYSSQYIYKMECSSAPNSCYNVEISVPSSVLVTDNWMELICPSTNSADGVCDIDFICQDLSSSGSTSMTWKSSSSRYECRDQKCCPWTDPDFMIEPPTNAPTQQPSNTPSVAQTINMESNLSIIDRMNYFVLLVFSLNYLIFFL